MEKMTIKAARINVGLTQEMLAEKMGGSPSNYKFLGIKSIRYAN